MFVAAMTGFFALSALSAYWALAFVARPATATIKAASVTMPMQTVNVYFSNSDFNKKMIDCNMVYPVQRQVQQTPAIARSALLRTSGSGASNPNASAMSSTSRESGATSIRRSIEGFALSSTGNRITLLPRVIVS